MRLKYLELSDAIVDKELSLMLLKRFDSLGFKHEIKTIGKRIDGVEVFDKFLLEVETKNRHGRYFPFDVKFKLNENIVIDGEWNLGFSASWDNETSPDTELYIKWLNYSLPYTN